MRLIILAVCFLTLPTQSEVDSENIYLLALMEHLDYLKDFHQENPDLFKMEDVYFIEENPITTTDFPHEINGYEVEILSVEEITNKVKGGNSITLLVIRPVQWRNDQMEIHVIEYGVSGNKRNLNYVHKMNGSSFVIKSTPDCQGLQLEMIKK